MIADNGVWLSMQPFTADDNAYPSEEQQRKHEMIVAGTDNTYKLAKRYGVRLAWGTDLLFNPAKAKDQNRGISKLARWFSNYEILKMVTRDNAELLALSDRRNPYPPARNDRDGRLGRSVARRRQSAGEYRTADRTGEKLSADRQGRNDMQATGRLRAPDPREAPPNGEKTNGSSGSRHAGLKPTKSRSDRTNARPTVRQATAPGNTVGRTERVQVSARGSVPASTSICTRNRSGRPARCHQPDRRPVHTAAFPGRQTGAGRFNRHTEIAQNSSENPATGSLRLFSQ